MKKCFPVCILLGVLPVSLSMAAVPGDLDLTFNKTGFVTTLPAVKSTGFNGAALNQRDLDKPVRGMIQQADGRLVVVGNNYDAKGTKRFALLRYNLDGSLDTTWNGTGMVTTVLSDQKLPKDDAHTVIQQFDGRLVAAGSSFNGSNDDCAVVRYNKDGSLDETFGGSGTITFAFGISDDRCYSVVQQEDGKLVVAGQTTISGNGADFAIARINPDGSLDDSFGNGGRVTTDINANHTNNYGMAVIRQVDGKLLMAGYSDYEFVMVRYDEDGSLDTTLNGTGMLFAGITTNSDYAVSVIQQADEKLVLAGYSTTGTNSDFAIARYNLDGSFDTTFNGTGKLVLPVGTGSDGVAQVIQQTDGKLVLAGYSVISGSKHTALVRLDTDGSLDTTFGGDGKQTTVVGSVIDEALSVVQQADGKLVVAGYGNDGKSNYMMLARYNSENDSDDDGVPDSLDAFPNDATESVDTDHDGTGNTTDPDDDGDGVADVSDNCPLVSNSDQADANHDGYGDVCAGDAPALNITRGAKPKVGVGTVVAFAGDIDEDGYGDYIIGYPTYDPVGKTDAGRAEVISGKTGDVLPGMFIEGAAAKDNMGFAVAGNADVDGDTHLDVVVGAPKADPGGLKDAGTVTILYGPNGARKTTLSGTRANALLGAAVALGADNAGAYVVAGAPKDNDTRTVPVIAGAGSVTVFIDGNGSNRKTFYGTVPKAYAGTSVAVANFDGNAGIVIGAPGDDIPKDVDFGTPAIKDVGSVSVYSVNSTGGDDYLMYEYGQVAKASLGKSVAAADMDGDGNAEILAGAPGDTPLDDNDLPVKTRKNVGSVNLYSGGGLLWSSFGRTVKAGLGNSVAFGDVNSDGFQDIIAGAAKDDRPALKVVKDTGSVSIWDGVTFGKITTLFGSVTKDYFGTAVAAGDVNADGSDDLMIGIGGADTPAVLPAKPVKDTGAVQVLSGAVL